MTGEDVVIASSLVVIALLVLGLIYILVGLWNDL